MVSLARKLRTMCICQQAHNGVLCRDCRTRARRRAAPRSLRQMCYALEERRRAAASAAIATAAAAATAAQSCPRADPLRAARATWPGQLPESDSASIISSNISSTLLRELLMSPRSATNTYNDSPRGTTASSSAPASPAACARSASARGSPRAALARAGSSGAESLLREMAVRRRDATSSGARARRARAAGRGDGVARRASVW